MKHLTRTFACIAMAATILSAQSMEGAIAKLGKAGAEAYMAPIASGIGANLNAGWYYKAPPLVKYGFNANAGIVSMGTLLKGAKTMNVSGSMRLDTSISAILVAGATDDPALRDSLKRRLSEREFDVQFLGPTVIGSEGTEVKIVFVAANVETARSGASDTTVFIPSDTVSIANLTGLLDGLASLPLFTPQITFGTLYGTNLTLRWLPAYESLEEIGPIDLFGFGIQHNPGIWFKKALPIDVCVGYFQQSLKGNFFNATAYALGLNVTKSFGWRFFNVAPYLGGQWERSTFDIEYDLTAYDEVQRVTSSFDGDNTYRVTAGMSVQLLAINVSANINYAQNPSYSLGVMVGF